MPKNSQGDHFHDWDTTLRAVRKNKARLAGVGPYFAALEKAYGEAVANRGQSDALQAASQETTRQLNLSLVEGRDAARRLRSFIKSVLGIHSEQLVAYGMKPVRKRPRLGRQAASPEAAN